VAEPVAPLPALDAGNIAFWTGGRDGHLLITRCENCSRWSHPPVPVCRFCLSDNVGPQPSSGTGRVLTFTVNRQPWLPTLPPPYVIAVIGLDDDPQLRVSTRLVEVDPEEVRIGMRVQVLFEPCDDIWLPLFRPAGARR
jgi:uncharacterized protein